MAKYVKVSERKEKTLEIINKEKKFNQIVVSLLDEEGNNTNKKEFYLVENTGLKQLKMDEKDFKEYKITPINLEQKFLLNMLFNKKS